MAVTKIILTEKIDKLGAEGDVVTVRMGYARNFLLPKGKALEASARAMGKLAELKSKRAAREAEELNAANDLARRINKVKLEFTLETASGEGKTFGSVSSTDILEKLRGELGGNTELDRHCIQLEKPIKTAGEFEVPYNLVHDVVATIQVTVTVKAAEAAPEGEEGAGKYKGKKGGKGPRTKGASEVPAAE